MQNFIKTIISGLQSWIRKEIKQSTADWNQNDSNADNYIKNRTHWEEVDLTTLMEEKEFTDFSVDAKGFFTSWVDLNIDFVPQIGEEYIIIWDGEEYQVIMEEQEGATWCGIDYYTPGLPENAIRPFGLLFHFREPILQAIITTSDAPSHTLSIIKSDTIIHKLDKKFVDMPDNMATIENVQEAKDETLEVANSKITYQTNTINLGKVYNYITSCNNLFFALRIEGNKSTSVYYSIDGVRWKLTNLPSYQWKDVAYGDGRFVAVGYNCAAYSQDGINWTFSSSGSGVYAGKVIYGNDKFVAIGHNRDAHSRTQWSYHSFNGIDWIGTAVSTNGEYINDIAYGNNVFIAVGHYYQTVGGEQRILYSVDGVTWQVKSLPITGYWNAVIFENNEFIIIHKLSTTTMHSTDGINWTYYKNVNSNSRYHHSLIYANNHFLTTGFDYVTYSKDGIDWIEEKLPFKQDSYSTIAYENNLFIISGLYGIYGSRDLKNWSQDISQLIMSETDITEQVSSTIGFTDHANNIGNPHYVTAEQINAIPTPPTAQVGQVLSVKSVDENGKPTEWETINSSTDGNKPLTFTGAVSATYDGSQAVEVEIPQGGGGVSAEWNTICEGQLAEAVSSIVIDSAADGTPQSSLDVNEMLIFGRVILSANSKLRFEHNGLWTAGNYTNTDKEYGNWTSPFCVHQRKFQGGIITKISIGAEHITLFAPPNTNGYLIKSFEIHVATDGVTFTVDNTYVNAYYR